MRRESSAQLKWLPEMQGMVAVRSRIKETLMAARLILLMINC